LSIDDDFSFDVDILPTPFAAPTLFLTGRQDNWCGYQDAYRLLDNYPRASFSVLDRAGHALPVEQKTLFRALVNEWLDRVEEYAPVASSKSEPTMRGLTAAVKPGVGRNPTEPTKGAK
jgi:hypothetical protein